jgi:hypothetical protein
MTKPKTTSKRVAKKSSKVLRFRKTSTKSKASAGSTLSKTKSPEKTTSRKAASSAPSVLRDGRTSKDSRSAAGSALAQKKPKVKRKK